MRPQWKARTTLRALALVLAATVLPGVATPGVASADGPSVELPKTKPVPMIQLAGSPRDDDPATKDALRGDNLPRGNKDGSGTSTATTLAPSSTWDTSEQTGDFSTSYPLRVPPAPGGLAPNLALSYRSSAVDGHTSVTNNQASWIGEGWDLSPGFVERTYGNCVDDDVPQKGDLCWRSDNATAAFDGGGGMLIRDDNARPEKWRAKNDNGARIERIVNPQHRNGDNDGEHWKITTVDGTQYWFGSQTDAASTWTVPVFGDDVNEPCNRPGSFDASSCVQGWRWNLDKVVDPNGNIIRYFYKAESNSYGMNGKDAAVSYTRGGTLWKVEYGLHATVGGQASAQVEFTVADRCIPGSVCDQNNKAHRGNFPDTPLDSGCDGATCPGQHSPSFWSTKRLATITTRVLRESSYSDVDRWELDQHFPDPGDGEKPALWLKGIKHTGLVGGSLALPSVTFEGAKFANRVYAVDGEAPLNRYRITAVLAETGGITQVNYARPECVPGERMPNPDAPQDNTLRCFPVTWTRPNHAERTDFFHKYVVESIVQSDRWGTSAMQVTNYEYFDGAAWHWDTSEFVKDAKKTWNEFRGFGRVRVRAGSDRDPAGPVTMSDELFYRGMNGNRATKDGGTRSVVLRDSEDTERTDHDWLAGVGYESRAFERGNRPGETDPPLLGKTITDSIWKGPTAKRGIFEAYITRLAVQHQFTALKSGGWRKTRVETTYDDNYGLPLNVNDLGDLDTAADDRCTRTRYLHNTTDWVLDQPSTVDTVSVSCGTTARFPDDAVSNTRTWYDGQEHNKAPTRGNPTKVEVAKEWPAADRPVWVTGATAAYDEHGRVKEATDAAGNLTKTKFTPLTGGPVTGIMATSPPTPAVPAGMVTTTTLEPAFGLPTLITDPNNRTTKAAYDPLGRKVEVWLPNRPQATHARGNVRFSYSITKDKPPVVTTSKIGPNGVFTSGKTLFDGMLRTRQIQTPAVGGGRLIAYTKYDSQGRVYKTTQPFFNDGAVDDEVWVESDVNVLPGLTRTEYDGAGRAVASVYVTGATDKWRSTTAYEGDRVHVTPPDGGTATTTIADARGRTTELRQYLAATPSGEYDSTVYRYNRAGYLSEVVAPGGATWKFGYDLRGNKIESQDPDSGLTTTTYDNAGRLESIKDARGVELFYAYDSLSRKINLRHGAKTGPKLAEWAYDTAGGGRGQLASSTRFVDNQAYKTSVGSYTELYQPNDSTVSIPAVPGLGLLAGNYTWRGGYGWDGSLSGETYPAAGDLKAEDVNYVHDDWGRLLSSSGNHEDETVELVTNTLYTRYGEVERVQLGEGTKRVWLSTYFDSQTRRVERSIVDAEVPAPMQSDVRYTYEDAGFTKSVAEAAPGQTDTQCYKHDHVGRMTHAWTPAGVCTAPSSTGLGGAAPFWLSYEYDKSGNRKQEVRHASAGDTTRTYRYPENGQQPHTLLSVTGGVNESFTYNAAGFTTNRTKAGASETLNWDAEGHLASVTGPGGTTSFIYTADGDRLLRKDPSGTTLYLGNTEVHLPAVGGSPVATRFYSYGGKTIAVRKGAKLTWMTGDQRATQLTIDSSTMQVTRRRQHPFGSPRGEAPTFWPDQRAFVGGTLDSSTGLTHLGAREYDTGNGRFISVDPILDVHDPQQMNGYAYGNNNPSSFSDASGLRSCGPDGKGCGQERKTNNAMTGGTGKVAPPSQKSGGGGGGGGKSSYVRDHGGGFVESYNARENVSYINDLPLPPSAPPVAELVPRVKERYGSDLTGDPGTDWHLEVTFDAVIIYCRENLEYCGTNFFGWLSGSWITFLAGSGNLETGRRGKGGGGIGKTTGGIRAVRGENGLDPDGGCSFDGDTEVLMADGTTKPISKIKKGDEVIAADPETGEKGLRTVVAVIVHEDKVVELTTGNGDVTTTEDHPFYNATDKQWQRADELDPGDQLTTASGRQAKVVGLRAGTTRVATAYNLTVQGIHTFYVLAGTDPVLVHNMCPQRRPDGGGSFSRVAMNRESVNSVAAKYGLDLSAFSDITFNKAKRTPEGFTSETLHLDLRQGAFVNEAELAKTLYHELVHVDQLQAGAKYPEKYDKNNVMEAQAEILTQEWWKNHPLNK